MNDRNALQPQDPQTFLDVTQGATAQERGRLMELATLIPESDGIGDERAKAIDAEVAAREAWDAACDTSRRLAERYLARITLMEEERAILQGLGLTENLYRRHMPDYSAGEGLDS